MFFTIPHFEHTDWTFIHKSWTLFEKKMATQDDKGSRLSVKKPAELIKIHPTDKQPRSLVHIWPIVLPLKKEPQNTCL